MASYRRHYVAKANAVSDMVRWRARVMKNQRNCDNTRRPLPLRDMPLPPSALSELRLYVYIPKVVSELESRATGPPSGFPDFCIALDL